MPAQNFQLFEVNKSIICLLEKEAHHDPRHDVRNVHFLARADQSGWNGLFLATTVLTSVSGFGFPFDHLLPSHVVGLISLVVLAAAVAARYALRLAGPWRWIYVVESGIALYLNVFVLVVQGFEKVPALKALAPTQKEPPFLVAQLVVLLIFAALIILAAKRFHIEPESVRARAA